MNTKTMPDLDTFTRAYIEAALWSSSCDAPDGGEGQMDEFYSADDIAPSTLSVMVADCADFQAACGDYIVSDMERAGHDFWLTRNGHGTGFWDGDWEEKWEEPDNYSLLRPMYATVGDYLTAMSKPYGSFDLYVGDDGMIHGQ